MKKEIILIMTVLVLMACNEYTPKKVDSPPTQIEQGITENQLSYNLIREQVFKPYCIRCHSTVGGNPKGVNLETYPNVMRDLSRVIEEAVTYQSMPPKTSMPLFARNLLKKWVDRGAPLNPKPTAPSSPSDPEPGSGASPTPSPNSSPLPTTSLEPTWDSLSKNIFVPKCLRCHGPTHQAHDISFENKSWVTDPANELVIPGNAKGSELYRAVVGDGVKLMPLKANPLSKAEVDTLAQWIQNGAKD